MYANLKGNMPEPILVILSETWDTFELTGEENEYIVADLIRTMDDNGMVPIGEKDIPCKTVSHEIEEKVKGGIQIPKEITQKHRLQIGYPFEVILKEVKKGDKKTLMYEKEKYESYPLELMKAMERFKEGDQRIFKY